MFGRGSTAWAEKVLRQSAAPTARREGSGLMITRHEEATYDQRSKARPVCRMFVVRPSSVLHQSNRPDRGEFFSAFPDDLADCHPELSEATGSAGRVVEGSRGSDQRPAKGSSQTFHGVLRLRAAVASLRCQ